MRNNTVMVLSKFVLLCGFVLLGTTAFSAPGGNGKGNPNGNANGNGGAQGNSARIVSCGVVNSTPLNFGFTPGFTSVSSVELTPTSTVSMACTCSGNGDIKVSGSTYIPGPDNSNLSLPGPIGASLNYGVYSSTQRTLGFTYPNSAENLRFSFSGICPTGGNNVVKNVIFPTTPSFVLYGKMPISDRNKNARAGTYSGALTFTISY